MPIQVYESRARKVLQFDPREPGRITMYACGPTVYGYVHVGNARTALWYDFIRRYFMYRGFDVVYVMNYTDVDDKIIERSKVEGIPAEGVSRKYTKAFEDDMAALNVEPPDLVVRATDHIEDMVKAVEGLIEKGLAYESDGDVYYAVEQFEGYGKLSHRSLEDMRAGERVEVSEHKRHPLDFALWKAAKENEPSWPSPWGPGRPGWHIECSVMSTKYLGMGFDIHGGARDLIFPHHENELAQAEGLAGDEPFVRYWVHAGLVQFESEKMSKSLGNTVLAHDVVEEVPGEAA
ncbi:MAG: cysteine--tRNA ligase, partial [Actinomycetota bacterium]